MAEFLERESDYFCLFCVEKEATEFGFGGGGSDEFEDCAQDVDCAVEEDGFACGGEVTEKEISCRSASCVWGRKIAGV